MQIRFEILSRKIHEELLKVIFQISVNIYDDTIFSLDIHHYVRTL